jgi:hypothetical protein
MIRAGSKWIIYTRNGGVRFSINKDIVLNLPNKGKLTPPDSLMAKYFWFSEVRTRKEKVIELWQILKKIHPNIRIIQIIYVEDYYCLISEEHFNCHDYRMYPIE